MEWWKFNGYGVFVCGSYLTALAVVIVENAMLAARHRRARMDAAERESFADAATRATGAAGATGAGRAA